MTYWVVFIDARGREHNKATGWYGTLGQKLNFFVLQVMHQVESVGSLTSILVKVRKRGAVPCV